MLILFINISPITVNFIYSPGIFNVGPSDIADSIVAATILQVKMSMTNSPIFVYVLITEFQDVPANIKDP